MEVLTTDVLGTVMMATGVGIALYAMLNRNSAARVQNPSYESRKTLVNLCGMAFLLIGFGFVAVFVKMS